jgi:hypothetical protein
VFHVFGLYRGVPSLKGERVRGWGERVRGYRSRENEMEGGREGGREGGHTLHVVWDQPPGSNG